MNTQKTKIKIGIDEAGRWPWCGPVVACALAWNPRNMPEKKYIQAVGDSKKLSETKREELYNTLIDLSGQKKLFFWVWVVDNYLIDELNIRQANREAMRRAIIEIRRKIPNDFESVSVVIDGKDNYEFQELDQKPLFLVWGDGKVSEISAASIIAKVFRDKLMAQYATLYPEFGFENNAGYGTKKHKDHLQNIADVTGIHRTSYKPVKQVLEKKEKLLLHICCWPDATVPIMDLKKDYEVICFWYDPNIQPKKEYDKRLEAFIKVCEIEGVEWIEGEYDVKNFFTKIKGLEDTPEKWEKCTECYDMRLERTAKLAREMGITKWTSTLNTSPHKDLEKMFYLGEKWDAETFGEKLEFLKIAFRKNWGFQRSVDYTKKHDIYRQNYCGCVYSDTFPGKEKPGAKKGFSG